MDTIQNLLRNGPHALGKAAGAVQSSSHSAPVHMTDFDVQEMGKTAAIDAYVTKAEVTLEHAPPPQAQVQQVQEAQTRQHNPPVRKAPERVDVGLIPKVNLYKLAPDSPLREYINLPGDTAKHDAMHDAKKHPPGPQPPLEDPATALLKAAEREIEAVS